MRKVIVLSVILGIIAFSTLATVAQIDKNKALILKERENLVKLKNDLSNRQQDKIAFYQELGQFKTLAKISEVGLNSTRIVAHDKSKGLLNDALSYYEVYTSKSSAEKTAMAVNTVDSIINKVEDYAINKTEEKLINSFKGAVDEAFTTTLDNYNQKALEYNQTLNDYPYTVKWHGIQPEPYLSEDGKTHELVVKKD